MNTSPHLTVLEAESEVENTLVVLHGNDSSPESMRPFYADLTAHGWRVALACSGQESAPGTFVWNDIQASQAAAEAWAGELGTTPYWAGFSAGSYIALRGVLQGHLPGRGILAAVPSIPSHPSWWPQGWSAQPVKVPVAFVVGENDQLTPPDETRSFAARLAVQGVTVRVWSHEGGHEHPDHWIDIRDQALTWLTARQVS